MIEVEKKFTSVTEEQNQLMNDNHQQVAMIYIYINDGKTDKIYAQSFFFICQHLLIAG